MVGGVTSVLASATGPCHLRAALRRETGWLQRMIRTAGVLSAVKVRIPQAVLGQELLDLCSERLRRSLETPVDQGSAPPVPVAQSSRPAMRLPLTDAASRLSRRTAVAPGAPDSRSAIGAERNEGVSVISTRLQSAEDSHFAAGSAGGRRRTVPLPSPGHVGDSDKTPGPPPGLSPIAGATVCELEGELDRPDLLPPTLLTGQECQPSALQVLPSSQGSPVGTEGDPPRPEGVPSAVPRTAPVFVQLLREYWTLVAPGRDSDGRTGATRAVVASAAGQTPISSIAPPTASTAPVWPGLTGNWVAQKVGAALRQRAANNPAECTEQRVVHDSPERVEIRNVFRISMDSSGGRVVPPADLAEQIAAILHEQAGQYGIDVT